MHIKQYALLIVALILPFCVYAAAPAGSDEDLKITGSLDMNYQFNFNNPRPVTAPADPTLAQPGGNIGYRVFDQYHDNLNLALVELIFQKKKGPTAVYVSLGYGSTADVLSPRDIVSKNITEAYLTFTPETQPKLSISVGKMFTHMGLEVVRTKSNWNYSRSVLFGYAIPLWHVGAAAKYEFMPDGLLKGALFVYNETVGLYGVDPGKTYGAQISGIPIENATLTYNLLSGTEMSSDGVSHTRTLHEIIPTYVFNEYLQANADIVYGELTNSRANQSRNAYWNAWSLGLKYTQGDFSLSPRIENYTDRSGATIETAITPALPLRIESATLTGAWTMGGGLETRLELRYDKSSSESFTTGNGDTKDSQSSATVGMLYDF